MKMFENIRRILAKPKETKKEPKPVYATVEAARMGGGLDAPDLAVGEHEEVGKGFEPPYAKISVRGSQEAVRSALKALVTSKSSLVKERKRESGEVVEQLVKGNE